jgi:hypothetical protein
MENRGRELRIEMLLGAHTPGLKILNSWRGLAVHAVAQDRVWGSRGGRLYTRALTGGPWQLYDRLPEPAWQRLIGRSAFVGQALRLGIHGVLPLGDRAALVVGTGCLWNVDAGRWHQALTFDFRKPARLGVLRTREGLVFCAEYTLNPRRDRPIRLWRSDDDARSFQQIFAFPAGQVRHIHFIQQDPVDGSLWLGTGDRDAESAIWRSTDNGATWQIIGGGDQRWRAIGVAFLPDAVIWGTDGGSDAGAFQNVAVRWDRHTQQLTTHTRLPGPVHGVTALPDGQVLLGTGCEGGVNEADRRVHLFASDDGRDYREIASFAGGLQPKRAQYPVLHFAQGQGASERIWLIGRGILAASVVSWECRVG